MCFFHVFWSIVFIRFVLSSFFGGSGEGEEGRVDAFLDLGITVVDVV